MTMLLNPLVTLGTGVGMEIRGNDLVAALVKSRWKGVTVAAKGTISDFRQRPAAEWGREYRALLGRHGFADVPATLALPREEVIVRLLTLPAAARQDLASAVRLQLDSLHPYGEDNVYYSFATLEPASTAGNGAAAIPASVAVVIAARAVVDAYADLFAEAGVKLRGFTVAAAAYYGASRLLRRRTPEPFLLADVRDSVFELYGESLARPFFSATFNARAMPIEKAVGAASADLRFPEDKAVPLMLCGERLAAEADTVGSTVPAEQVLGSPLQSPPEFDLKRDATVFATGLAAACPRWGWRTNLLPAARRSSGARWPMAVTVGAVAMAAVVALLLWLRGPIQDRRYAAALEREVKRLEAVEREIRGLERQAEQARSRRRQLESWRRRPEADLALLTEISRRLPNNAWLSTIEIAEDSTQLSGQAESAAPLLGVLDSSPLLRGAAFVGSITRNESREGFRIRATRRAMAEGPAPPAAPPLAVAAGPVHR